MLNEKQDKYSVFDKFLILPNDLSNFISFFQIYLQFYNIENADKFCRKIIFDY